MMNSDAELSARGADSVALFALVSAVLGVVAVIVVYWLILPAVVLGLIAVILGVIARRRAAGARARDMATVALCLGVVSILFTPVVLMQTSGAEDWGRDCALHPEQDENCPETGR